MPFQAAAERAELPHPALSIRKPRGAARLSAKSARTRVHSHDPPKPLQVQTNHLSSLSEELSLQCRLFTYRVLLRVADFHPKDVIQQPVNGFVLIEHQYELHDQAQIQRLEHFSYNTKKGKREQLL